MTSAVYHGRKAINQTTLLILSGCHGKIMVVHGRLHVFSKHLNTIKKLELFFYEKQMSPPFRNKKNQNVTK